MLLNLLFSSPMIAVAWILAILIALTVHEFSHAVVGKWRGDDTAEKMGRLTLNPLAHLDPLGTIMLLFVGFGWAKPVPFDPAKLRHPVYDGIPIALAGPFANFLLAILAAIFFRGLIAAGMLNADSVLPIFLVFLMLINLLLMFFNLIPVPPLDGSKVLDAVLFKFGAFRLRQFAEVYGPQVLLGLVIISMLTRLNVFIFVQIPALMLCDAISGVSCSNVLGAYLGG